MLNEDYLFSYLTWGLCGSCETTIHNTIVLINDFSSEFHMQHP
jgi:hypothetical protein